ncbi:cation:proton antiporter regulatory subunit [Methanoculleus sp. UBA303]|jgi:TrkA domain protein|uniref:cation:proton antiporter regulatory subunit n=1 Tax=Methanoculleus sp. UBA303 TaxID=1915497 RepID=UPI0025E6D99F|nr:TrkA C-terminal domain-containing protein [Methanoculleus sp. UBA303]MDD3934258.1 TrkA C-terminal domain-containing protein [Methanoculleus sp.]
MPLRSRDLPGIGTKYEFESVAGDTIAVIWRASGNVQVYLLAKDFPVPCVAELSGAEARWLGSILSGSPVRPAKEGVEIIFSTLTDLRIGIRTCTVGKRLAGRCAGDLPAGVTVIAISRGGKNITNPPPGMALLEGDLVIAVGESGTLEAFEEGIQR